MYLTPEPYPPHGPSLLATSPHHSGRRRGWQASGHMRPPSTCLCLLFTSPLTGAVPAGDPGGQSHQKSAGMVCPYLCLAGLQNAPAAQGPTSGSRPGGSAWVIVAAERRAAGKPRNSQLSDNEHHRANNINGGEVYLSVSLKKRPSILFSLKKEREKEKRSRF